MKKAWLAIRCLISHKWADIAKAPYHCERCNEDYIYNPYTGMFQRV